MCEDMRFDFFLVVRMDLYLECHSPVGNSWDACLRLFPAASRGTAGELCTPERQNRTTHRAGIARGSPCGTCCHKPWRYMSPTTRPTRGSERSQGVLCHKREVTSRTAALAGNESHALGREGSRHWGQTIQCPLGAGVPGAGGEGCRRGEGLHVDLRGWRHVEPGRKGRAAQKARIGRLLSTAASPSPP